MKRQVICPICKKEWDLRSGGMAYQSLNRHIKLEHREAVDESIRQSA